MSQPVKLYARRQGITAAMINAVLNPALAWLGNHDMKFVPLSEGHSIVIDTAVTSVLLSLLVSLFITAGVHRDLAAGRITASGGTSRKSSPFSRLPGQAWALGLMLGLGAAFVLVLLVLGLFHVMAVPGLSFAGFALFKAVYTALLAFVLTRLVIFRQLLPVPQR